MNTVLFDLDGTLLPMDMQVFTAGYFRELAKTCASHGYEPDALVAAVWAGTKAMVANDGTRTNEECFWALFSELLGSRVLTLKDEFESFYSREFHNVRQDAGENPNAAPAVRALREKGYTVALATNPLFPAVGVRTRLSWIGLTPADFDHVTTYETAHWCKPSLGYYKEILRALGKQPEDCLMIGNDLAEDGCVQALGMACYLTTDCMIGDTAAVPPTVRTGTFAACRAMLDALLPVDSSVLHSV